MALRDATSGTGFSQTPTVNVPTGVVSGDIIVILMAVDSSTATVTNPTGFSSLDRFAHQAPDGQTSALVWKRATASDTGTYAFGSIVVTSVDWVVIAVALSGRSASRPVEASPARGDQTGNTSPISLLTQAVQARSGDDLIWFGAPDETTGGGSTGFDPPSGFTELEDASFGGANASAAIQENVSAGSTTAQGTFNTTNTAGRLAWLVRVPSADASAPAEHTPLLAWIRA